MTARGYIRGHAVAWDGSRWRYEDEESVVAGRERPCAFCGLAPDEDGYDACLGHVPGAVSACCGHGAESAYAVRTDGVRVEAPGGEGPRAALVRLCEGRGTGGCYDRGMTTKQDESVNAFMEDLSRNLRERLKAASLCARELPEPVDAALRTLDEVLREVVGRRDDFPDARELMETAACVRRYMVAGRYDLARHALGPAPALERHAVLGHQRVREAVDRIVLAVYEHGNDAMRAAFRTNLYRVTITGTITV